MSSNAYPSPYPHQSHQSPQQAQAGSSGGSINPALLASFQHNQSQPKFPSYGGGSVNPAHLLNGMGSMNHNPQQQMQGMINPAQVLQQQQQQHHHNAMNSGGIGVPQGGMNNFFDVGVGMGSANNNMNMGMGSINPAALTGGGHPSGANTLNAAMMGMGANSPISNASNMNLSTMMMSQMNSNTGGNFSQVNMNAMNPANPPHQANAMATNNINASAALSLLGMTKEQFSALSPKDKQFVWQKATLAMQQQSQMQFNQGGQHISGQAANLPAQGMGNHQPQTMDQYQNPDMLQNLLGRSMSSGNTGGITMNAATNPAAAMPNFYDRPSSSASTSSHSQMPRSDASSGGGMHAHQMMPPPPPRPPTAQSQGHHSRPNTAMAHHSPTSAMHPPLPVQRPPSRSQQQQQPQMPRPDSRGQQFQAGQQGIQRPPSRAQHMSAVAGAMNGFQAKHPQVQPSGQPFSGMGTMQSPVQQFLGGFPPQVHLGQQPSPQQVQQSSSHSFVGQASPSPTTTVPGSPLRVSKRKLGPEGSPRLGYGFHGSMGPPTVVPKTSSENLAQVGQMAGMGMNNASQSLNVNGGMFPVLPSHSPRPGSANSGGHGMPHNMMDMSPSTSVMPTMDVASKNSVLGMSLNMGPEMMPSTGRGSQPPPSQPIQPQSHSRQSSMPPQFPSVPPQAVPLGQQHMRQGSLPPSAAMLNNVPVKNEMRSSVPPAPVLLPGGTNSVSQGTSGPMPSVATRPPTNQGPPLPAGANPATTKVTLVPLAESLVNIPDLSEEEVKNIQSWIKTDQEYDGVWRKTKERMAGEMVEIFGPRTLPWWEKGSLDATTNRSRKGRENFDIRYPRKPKDPSQRRKGARREGLKLPQRLNSEDVSKPEQLVPIRLEFDVEHHKMRDTFVWNLNDPIITPEHFAQTLIEDYNLAPSYHAIITKSIQDQLSDYKAHTVNYDGEDSDAVAVQADTTSEDVVLKGKLDDENSAWWEAWRKRLRAEYLESSKQSAGKSKKRRKCADEKNKEKPMTIDEFDIDEQALNEEMRILIKLDIVVGSMKLDDQFEWDLDNTHASPEEFAEVYAQDLGLGGEFKTAIAHSIREQVQAYQKSLFLVGHPADGSTIQDDELRSGFLPILTSGARSLDQVQVYTPLLNYHSDGEIERSEREREKDMVKRRKRNTRGRRGVALPDREPVRTYRTPAIGFPEVDPAILALAAAASAPSRRAAAAAASVTIANMVASENGVPFMPQTLPSAPQQPPPQVSKEKKVNGFFKAPPVPQSALRPRAHVAAPTLSTAADITKLPAPLENDPPPVIRALPDNKITKVISAKRAKELEREAKEKEYVDGQHPNFIDGVWHCSNCGCPESIAIGRRKGPLGDKSQCGTCGKYWHRHRRPRPVEYTPDPEHHSGLRREAELTKSASKKKGRAQLFAAAAEASEPQTPSRSNGDVENTSRAQSPLPSIPVDDDRAISPVSTASSSSEPLLSQKVKVNGTSHAKIAAPMTPIPNAHGSPSLRAAHPTGTPPSSPAKAWPPQWLTNALQAMRAKYPKDRFELTTKKSTGTTPGTNVGNPEWRLKCLDCPGKLYTPGPGETLSNYEVHLKNRQHRQRVAERLNNGTNSST